jgi:hypothetical protein
MGINDNENTTLKQKETKLKNLFNSHGLDIQFINEYPKQNEKVPSNPSDTN